MVVLNFQKEKKKSMVVQAEKGDVNRGRCHRSLLEMTLELQGFPDPARGCRGGQLGGQTWGHVEGTGRWDRQDLWKWEPGSFPHWPACLDGTLQKATSLNLEKYRMCGELD